MEINSSVKKSQNIDRFTKPLYINWLSVLSQLADPVYKYLSLLSGNYLIFSSEEQTSGIDPLSGKLSRVF